MSEKKETINYNDYVLDPSRDVLVPAPVYIALHNLVAAVEKQHSKKMTTDKYSFYNKKTNNKLSDKNKGKIDPAKLAAEYYENIDLEATAKTLRVDRDELGGTAMKLLGDFRGVFRHNVDQGNKMLRPELQTSDAPESVEQPVEPKSDES